ncbi:MAG TPA: peroxiredoxin-like family protein, partial [Labilithrix sp.]
ELAPRIAELDALGVCTAIIGSGTREQLEGFVDRLALHDRRVRVFTDPSLAVFRRAGLERSIWGTFGPVALVQLVRAVAHGHRNSLPPQGDYAQQGGTLLVRKGGEIVVYDRQASLGERMAIVDVVDAALRMRAAESVLP